MNEQPENPYRANPLDPEPVTNNLGKAGQPLSFGGKALSLFGGSVGCGFLSLIIVVIVSMRCSNRGEARKARDIWIWYGIGFVSMVVLVVLSGLLGQFAADSPD